MLSLKIMDKSETEIRVRPLVWAALAASVCILLAAVVGHMVTDRRSSGMTAVPDATAFAPSLPSSAGPAFVASEEKLSPYTGRTNIKITWNFSQNAPELTVEAFPRKN